MIGTALWAALAVAGVVLELVSRRSQRVASLAALLGWASSFRTGRILLLAGWLFLGVHFFSRATLPGR